MPGVVHFCPWLAATGGDSNKIFLAEVGCPRFSSPSSLRACRWVRSLLSAGEGHWGW